MTTDDGRKVIAKAHVAYRPGELKKSGKLLIWRKFQSKGPNFRKNLLSGTKHILDL